MAAIETAITPRSVFEGLTDDERAVLAIAILQLRIMPEIERRYPKWRETPIRQAANPRDRYWLLANSRVNELRDDGRLDAIVERLQTMGRWPDDEAT